ncbi:MAG TPA: hypothetical protein VJR89_17935 [Polyangiales bacterium]|nr:hypothetical protein [Polyangiales bacterium]
MLFASARRMLGVPRAHEWALLAVLVFLTDRYRWLMDDAFIYFRYADNLLFLGRGLVYNAGEYVEGYSSPLWMLLLLPLRALGIDYYTLVRALAVPCALAYGAALIWLNRRLSPAGAPIVNFPLAASAAHYGITTHFSSGLETPLVQLIAPLYAAALLAPHSALLQCAIALAPLARAECALLGVLFLPWVIFRTRRVPWWLLGVGLTANGGWLLFRVIYYADFLPNTFYLKDATQWKLGLEYLQNVSETHHWPWVLAALIALAVIGRRELRERDVGARMLMLGASFAYGVYVARIGGDMLYHRYAALPVCLLLCASAGVCEAALLQLVAARISRWLAPAFALLVCLGFGLAYPPQLLEHPIRLPRVSHKWRAVADPNWHRMHPSLEYNERRSAEDARQRALYAGYREDGEHPDPPIMPLGFCREAFRRFEAQIVHDYGLTDLVLARLPRPFGRPGHKLVQAEAQHIVDLRKAARSQGVPWYELRKVPRWVKANRAELALLERKLHNRHALGENLTLALTRVKLK